MHAIQQHSEHVTAIPRRILVASRLGEEDGALRVGCARAATWGAELALCHVGSAEPRRVAEHAVRILGDSALDCAVFAEHPGAVADAIARRAAEWGADLVIVGGAKHGDGPASRLWHSDDGWAIVRSVSCSVLVSRHTPGTGRMIVGTDLTEASTPAVQAAAAEQARQRVTTTLVHCLPMSWGAAGPEPKSLELEASLVPRLALIAAAAGLRAEPRLAFGDAGARLVEIASELAADLVVVGGRNLGPRRWRHGCATEQVVRGAPCAVLVVR